LPAFLKEQYGLTGTQVTMPLAVLYTMTTFGSVLGGWLPKKLMENGMVAFKARKLSMFMYALVPISVLFAQKAGSYNMWFAVIIIGLAASAHQAWSANIFTTVSDMFPKKAIASVTGIGGMAGAIGGMIIAWAAGMLFDFYKAAGDITIGYGIMFIICSLAYILAWIIMHVLAPKMDKVDI